MVDQEYVQFYVEILTEKIDQLATRIESLEEANKQLSANLTNVPCNNQDIPNGRPD